VKLYLIGNGDLSLPENPDSLVNFFLSYVVRKRKAMIAGLDYHMLMLILSFFVFASI